MACPVCSADSSSRLFLARDHHYGIPGSWWIRSCARCGSWFLENPPSPDELASLYPSETYYAYEAPKSPGLKHALQRALGVDLRPGDPAFPRPGRVLDFGCGSGGTLLRMRDAGWDCVGVEINPRGRAVAESLGLDVRSSMSELGDGAFDYVRANHSLEHVPEPRHAVAEFHRVLRPGGTLFLGVPTVTSQNARCFGAHWWFLTPPLHVAVFSTGALRDMVTRGGFAVTRVATRSDFGGTAGSLQIWLNRANGRPSTAGWVMRSRLARLVGHWLARVQDLCGVGDKLELTATRLG